MFRAVIISALLLLPAIASAQIYGATAYQAYTIGTTAVSVIPSGHPTIFLDFVNDSTTATIACAPSYATPAIGAAGSITIPPQWHRSWEGSFIPSDIWSCVASAASTPVTVGYK